MAVLIMTYELAMAAAHDAACRRMRKECRKKWNQEDWNHMCDTFDRLYGREALEIARARCAPAEEAAP